MSSRRRALALLFGSLVVVLAAGTILSVLVVRDQLLNDLDEEINISLATNATIFSRFDPAQFADLPPLGRTDALMLLRKDGADVEAFVPAGPAGDPLPLPDVGPERILNNIGDHFTVDGLDGGPDYRISSVEYADGSRVAAIARPLDNLNETIDTLIGTLLFTGLGVLAALAVLTWWILRSTLRSLEEMIDTADTIAHGDYSRRVDLSGASDDTARLGGALNSMLDQVEDSFAEQAESELRLKQFVSDASHELRTPLTTVRGYSELYLSGAATDPDSVTKQMSRINAEASRMGVLVEDLLTLARLDQGRGVEHERLELGTLVADVVADARVIDPDRAVVFDPPGQPVEIHGDDDRLRQILANILTNARTHTPPETPIHVAVSSHRDRAVVTIRDEGPGMDPAIANHVFDRFYQPEQSRNRSGGGSGLGLSIVKSIVEAHGGTVELETAPDEGATFTITLPHNDLAGV